MQFKITLRCTGRENIIPINYQYELSAWIYKVIRNADADYAAFLHHSGHTDGKKNFKLFCFSQLDIPKRKIEGDRIHILSATISFKVSFYVGKTAEEFVRGLFSEQQCTLGDRISRTDMRVEMVEMQARELANGPIRMRTGSPMTIGRINEKGNDDYLSPDDPDFERLFYINLLDKYRSATGNEIPSWWNTDGFKFRLLTESPRSQLITIKTGTDAETKVRGYRFEFEMDAPKELVEVGLLGGFGKFNAQGFGFGEIIG